MRFLQDDFVVDCFVLYHFFYKRNILIENSGKPCERGAFDCKRTVI